MKTSKRGIDLIKEFEGCRLAAYRDAVGVLTIGYGHTRGVYSGQTITQEKADVLLLEDLDQYERNVMSWNYIYAWSQNEFDALVSFAFNIGSIDQLTGYGKRAKKILPDKMLMYCHAGGQTLAGLKRRRERERELFLEGGSLENEVIISAKGE
jgi:GH24 family phage-related lysozyme (muramidase)